MNITVSPGKLSGSITAIPSKSHAHRLLICAAFADRPTTIRCSRINMDILATADCLRALGANLQYDGDAWYVEPIHHLPVSATLPCKESGSTLRFLLPIAGALGVDTTFVLQGRLPDRPLSPLWEEMERMGCRLSRPQSNMIQCTGRLRNGAYRINGGISSQFITGLMFAMALMDGANSLEIIGKMESKPYVDITRSALAAFGVGTENNMIHGQTPFCSPGIINVEGDWSNAAFYLTANYLGSNIRVAGLDSASAQGDRAVVDVLHAMAANSNIDAADIPDLVPVLAVAAGARNGATFHNIARLRLKESDRVASVKAMLEALGVPVSASENTLTVFPAEFHECTIDSCGDHRIAMSAAIAATVANGPVTILGAECVSKSYPDFWDDFNKLGGRYEQYIR